VVLAAHPRHLHQEPLLLRIAVGQRLGVQEYTPVHRLLPQLEEVLPLGSVRTRQASTKEGQQGAS
jgi:hypothetical protein